MEIGVEKLAKPQIICHTAKSVNFSLFDAKWIPCSAKFVLLGSQPNGRGIVQIFEICRGELKLINEFGKKTSLKCGTFGATNLRDRHLATGDFDGKLQVLDLERFEKAVYSCDAHIGIINSIEGIGGTSVGCGAPEIVTGGRDGSVKVWDIRQEGAPVAHMQARDGEVTRECWAVAAGNSYNSEERCIVSGYDNGDIKMFDLKNMSVRWEVNVKNGVCGLEFDRKDIMMNKLVATTLEGKIHLWDVRTQHETKGFSGLTEKANNRNTIWQVRHLPQNRDIFATTGGGGTISLWKYNYPTTRVGEDGDGGKSGIVGSLTPLQNATLSSQPINTLDWCSEKQGLAVCTSFDQTVRILITTKLSLY